MSAHSLPLTAYRPVLRTVGVFILSFLILNSAFLIPVQADIDSDLREIEKQINDRQHTLDLIKSANTYNKSQLSQLDAQIGDLKRQIDGVLIAIGDKKQAIISLEKKIGEQEKDLSIKEAIWGQRVKSLYLKTHADFPLQVFLSSKNFGEVVRGLGYRQLETADDKRTIVSVSAQIRELQDDKVQVGIKKQELEGQQARLSRAQADIDDQASFLRKEVAKASQYENQLSSEIAALSARQQELLAQKTGNFTTSVGDVPLSDDFNSSLLFNPGFSPAFAVFSYGAPHRVGMSQYGALGRAQAGQSAEDILKAYFPGTELKRDYASPATIGVSGYGRIAFEDNYLKGIAEMPAQWGDEGGMEALKAQAVAARTYALATTSNGAGTICPSEACQVYIGRNKGGRWEEAANSTRGWVLIKDGSPIKAFYSSTTGGFTHSSASVFGGGLSYAVGLADTTCGSQACWTSGAWEVKAKTSGKTGSPWFYKAWYKSRSGASGGRSHPWLTSNEMADILNAIVIYKKDNGTITHLSQTDAANADTWSYDRLKQELKNRGEVPVDSISGLGQTQYSTSGYTTTVSFITNVGVKIFSAEDFRFIFNIRAPGRLWIPTLYSGTKPVGPPFFNVEKK
ncbi:SpoIID/LytB domain-containing protein [Candidatus Daviesbacteria bacterium]|nr:SpoIID/LytB domain-containing protein [Candidatus Daviesbacteria bacterium]